MVATPCCHAIYQRSNHIAVPVADEYWSDGRDVGSRRASHEGVMRCKCGAYFSLARVIDTRIRADNTIANTDPVPDEELDAVLNSKPLDAYLEASVRRRVWRNLNDPYREIYRAHRAKVDKDNKPTWLEKIAIRLGINKHRPPLKFTVPPYEPTALQIANMVRLVELIERQRDDENFNARELAELHRQLGSFKAALELLEITEPEDASPVKVMRLMIEEGSRAPFRFRW